MPIHDWTRVDSGTYHNFHQGWTVDICRALNAGMLPPDFYAMIDMPERNSAPDVGISAYYARKANRIIIKHSRGRLIARIEIISPGNKDWRSAFQSFSARAAAILREGINLLIVDMFPPMQRHPVGIHEMVWNELANESCDGRPPDKPLTVVSYEVGDELAAYVETLAVGDLLPNAPLFVEPGRYFSIPLEETYQRSWSVLPQNLRDLVDPPAGGTTHG